MVSQQNQVVVAGKKRKDGTVRFKVVLAIENMDKEEKLELRCVNKVNKLRAEHFKRLMPLK